jgi:RNA polymerase-binding transcription factor DksA
MALTDQQRRHLEARLREERERAMRIIEQEDEDQSETPAERAGELSNVPFHMADVGTETYEQEMGELMRQRASDELREIDEALRRLVETPERYGLDEETGEPINFERLDLIPWARTRAPAARGDA